MYTAFCFVSGASLSTFQILYHLLLKMTLRKWDVLSLSPFLQVGKLRHRFFCFVFNHLSSVIHLVSDGAGIWTRQIPESNLSTSYSADNSSTCLWWESETPCLAQGWGGERQGQRAEGSCGCPSPRGKGKPHWACFPISIWVGYACFTFSTFPLKCLLKHVFPCLTALEPWSVNQFRIKIQHIYYIMYI